MVRIPALDFGSDAGSLPKCGEEDGATCGIFST